MLRQGGKPVKPPLGLAFASRLPTGGPAIPAYDYLPEPPLEAAANPAELAGALAMDRWHCGCADRQAGFCEPPCRARTRVHVADLGFAFNAGDWNSPDSQRRGIYPRNLVY